jgi:hypothetical protein
MREGAREGEEGRLAGGDMEVANGRGGRSGSPEPLPASARYLQAHAANESERRMCRRERAGARVASTRKGAGDT